jgi:uncharacterized membrane-anchored protein
MQLSHVPAAGVRYWAILSVASAFGANLGDFVSAELHLGHAKGLLPLAVLLLVILFVERRVQLRTEAFYWASIIVIRTGATNLADFLNFDLRLGYPAVLATLTVLMVLVVSVGSLMRRPSADASFLGLPSTGADYWVAMIVAGTLGTVIGDFCSFALDWGTGLASIALAVPLAALLFARSRRYLPEAASYWATVVAVRAAATAWGDHLAKSPTLKLGLPFSTLLTGTAFLVVYLAWRGTDRRVEQRPAGDWPL